MAGTTPLVAHLPLKPLFPCHSDNELRIVRLRGMPPRFGGLLRHLVIVTLARNQGHHRGIAAAIVVKGPIVTILTEIALVIVTGTEVEIEIEGMTMMAMAIGTSERGILIDRGIPQGAPGILIATEEDLGGAGAEAVA